MGRYMYGSMIYTAESNKKQAVILRLIGNSLIALIIARNYSYEKENLIRIFQNGSMVWIIIAILLADTALTLLWNYKRTIWTVHMVISVLLSGFYYGLVLDVCLDLNGTGTLIEIVLGVIMWIIGIKPFRMYERAEKELKNAEALQKEHREGETDE